MNQKAHWARPSLESGRPIAHVAADLGIHSETLRKRVRQAEADAGLRPDLPTSEEREEIKRLRQENFELRARERDLEVDSDAQMLVQWPFEECECVRSTG